MAVYVLLYNNNKFILLYIVYRYNPDFLYGNRNTSTYFNRRSVGACVFSDICFNVFLLKFNLAVDLQIRRQKESNWRQPPILLATVLQEHLQDLTMLHHLSIQALCLKLPIGNLIKDLLLIACSFYPTARPWRGCKKDLSQNLVYLGNTIK